MRKFSACHAIGQSNRKGGGDEWPCWTTETNFLPGRSFESLEDLKRSAFQWATERMEHCAVLIPA